MKTSLIVFGVIFLVIGVLLYLVPMQEITGSTTSGEAGAVSSISTARVDVPGAWALASGLIGFVLLVLGLVDFDQNSKRNDSRYRSFRNIFTSDDNFRGDGDKHKVVRQRTETRTTRKGEDFDLN